MRQIKRRKEKNRRTAGGRARGWKRWLAAAMAAAMLLPVGNGILTQAYAQGAKARAEAGTPEEEQAQESQSRDSVSETGGAQSQQTEADGSTRDIPAGEPSQGQTAASETAAQESQGQPAQEGGSAQDDQADAPAPEGADGAEPEGPPNAVALSVLEESLKEFQSAPAAARAEASIEVKQYAAESITVSLSSTAFDFQGGSLVKGENHSIPEYNESGKQPREYEEAGFVYSGTSDEPVILTGLYPYQTDDGQWEWYYTASETDETDEDSTLDNALDGVEAAYRLPDNVEIRLYYALTSQTTYTITDNTKGGVPQDKYDWNLQIDTEAGGNKAKAGEWVTARISLNQGIKRAKVGISGITATFGLARSSDDRGNMSATEWPGILDEATTTFQFRFEMPAQNVTVTIPEMVVWEDDGDGVVWGGIWAYNPGQHQYSHGILRFYATSVTKADGSSHAAITAPRYTARSGDVDGFGTYVDGGRPYVGYEAYATGFGSTPGTQYYSVSEGVSGQGNYGSGKGTTTLNPHNPATTSIPVREVPTGGGMDFVLESSWGRYASNGNFVYAPQGLYVDIYRQGGQYATGNFERTYIELPRAAGADGTVTRQLPGGAVLTVRCTNFAEGNAAGTDRSGSTTQSLNSMYRFTTGSGSAYQKLTWYRYYITIRNCTNDFKILYTNGSTVQQNYIIEKIAGVHEGGGAQTDNLYDVTSGTPTGSYMEDNSGKRRLLVEGSYFQPGVYPSDQITPPGGTKSGLWFYLQPYEGYGLPAITTRGWNSKEDGYRGDSAQYAGPYKQNGSIYVEKMSGSTYRYAYQPLGNTAASQLPGFNQSEKPMGAISIVSKPVEMAVAYWDTSSSKYYPTDSTSAATLKYSGTENYIIQPHVPSGTDKLKGYKLEVWASKDDDAGVPEKQAAAYTYKDLYPDDTGHSEQWLPGDAINVRTLYQKLLNDGKLIGGANKYEIRLIPDTAGDGSQWLVNGVSYSTYLQSGYFTPGTGTGNIYPTDALQNSFEKETRQVSAYEGTEVVLGGFPYRFEAEDGTKYIYDQTNSQAKAQVTSGAQGDLAWLYYLRGVGVQMTAPQGVSLTAEAQEYMNQWNADHADRWYIGEDIDIGGEHNHTVELPNVLGEGQTGTTGLPASIDGKRFDGWVIRQGTDASAGTYDYTIAKEETTLDLAALGENNSDIWNALFGEKNGASTGLGTLYLSPRYADSAITSTDNNNILKAGAPVTTYTHGSPEPGVQNGSFEITGTFGFSGDADALDGVQFAVTKQEIGRNASDPTEVIESDNSSSVIGYGTISQKADGSLSAELEGGTYVANNMQKLGVDGEGVSTSGDTFTLAFAVKDNGGSISYEWDEGAVYGVHAWGDGNIDKPDNGELANAGNSTIDPAVRTQATEELFLQTGKDIPGETHEVTVLPKKMVSGDDSNMIKQLTSPEAKLIYSETAFRLTADFGIDPNYPESLQIGTDAPEESKVHTAVYKVNPDGDEADGWVFEGEILEGGQTSGNPSESKVDAGSVAMKTEPDGAQSDDTVTVSYNFTEVDTITHQWEDEAVYYIVAWNNSNEEGGDFTETNLNPLDGSSRTKAPSVKTGLEMSKIMYSQEGMMYPGEENQKEGEEKPPVTPVETNVYMEGKKENAKGDEGTYSLEATFYMKGKVDESSDKTAYYAVYAQEPPQQPNADNTIWGITEKGSINLSDGSSERKETKEEGMFYTRFAEGTSLEVSVTEFEDEDITGITLKFTGINEVGRSPMIYRIYMWNAGNGDKTQADAGRSYSDDSGLEAAFLKTDYPCNAKQLYVIPRIYSEGAASGAPTIENQTKGKMFYEGDGEGDDIKISGTFAMAGSSIISVDDLLNDPQFAGELTVALYKQNPGNDEGAYQIFAVGKTDGSGGVTMQGQQTGDAVTEAVIEPDGEDGFTVTFPKANVSHEWDDGAKYRIYAWTNSNGTTSLPDNFGEKESGATYIAKTDIEGITTLPSVETLTTAVLGTEVESIIHYPKQITMLDNVNPADKHIYSANQKITITPVRDDDGNQAEIPDPDPGVDVVIQEIQQSQDVNAIQISRTSGSGTETINLTCFLGTINTAPAASQIGGDGKVGTLKFASPNELPLYFRSSAEPNVADGAPFTGQINFIFSKAAAGN